MGKVNVLDCTLRDGGYINNWKFGNKTIKGIVEKLSSSNIDIIECGFLRDVEYDSDVAVYSSCEQIAPLISPKRPNTLYVAMIALGDIAPEKISEFDGTSIDGIRITFHKHEWEAAKAAADILMHKGYRVFIQPVGTTSYTDEELLTLIDDVNLLQPYAFYLVDTLGIMYRRDLLRLFYLIEHNLDNDIKIGFHSHNNLQLSFSNAQEMMRQTSQHDIIIDASVYGMGRGVGNLSTELLVEYINVNFEQRYALTPLLVIADKYLMGIYANQRWGYDLPYFLSAAQRCHPNYASYLLKKETLPIDEIYKILSLLPSDKSDLYYPELIEEIYKDYQDCQIDDKETIRKVEKLTCGKKVLILAPGLSLKNDAAKINEFIKAENPLVVAVNFCPDYYDCDLLFVSNKKRLGELKPAQLKNKTVIAASNLSDCGIENINYINYSSYLGEGNAADNAGSMLIRLLKKANVKSVVLAGFDGFSVDSFKNYCGEFNNKLLDKSAAEQKNQTIATQLKEALSGIDYLVLTETRYQL